MEKSDDAMKKAAAASTSQATGNSSTTAKKQALKMPPTKQPQQQPPPKAKRALPGTTPAATTTTKKPRRAKALGKSTTTTTTATAATPVNVYDAVLGEAEDLLQAAAEAQALGRLKMASAYQLLLHARLVGLGKRFDCAQVQGPVPQRSARATSSPSITATATTASDESLSSPKTESSSSPAGDPAVKDELAKMLPQNVEMDTAMLEHLARAAMELHHQRTGRRIASDNITEPPPPKSSSSAGSTSVVWTEKERSQVQKALLAGTTSPATIASLLETRTEAQVRAYLRNLKERQKGSAQMEEELPTSSSDLVVSPRRRGGRGRKPPTQAMNTVPNAKLDAKDLLSGKGL